MTERAIMSCECDRTSHKAADGLPLACDAVGANTIIELFSPRPFDFGGLEASGTAEFVVAEMIDVSAHSAARLNVRNHGAIVDGSASLEVVVLAEAPSAEEPTGTFTSPDELAIATVQSGNTVATVPITSELGSAVRVLVRATQDDSAPVALSARLSAELVLVTRPSGVPAGQLVPAVRRIELDYSSLAPSSSESTVLVPALDVRDFRSGRLVLRVHDRSIGAGAQIAVHVQSAFPDPGATDTAFLVEDAEAELTILDGTTSELHAATLEYGFGPFLHVRAEATQSGSGGDLRASVSLDFIGQE